jgi:hypothetical protein
MKNAIITFGTNDSLVGGDEILWLHLRMQTATGSEYDVEEGHRSYSCRPGESSQTSIVADSSEQLKPKSNELLRNGPVPAACV